MPDARKAQAQAQLRGLHPFTQIGQAHRVPLPIIAALKPARPPAPVLTGKPWAGLLTRTACHVIRWRVAAIPAQSGRNFG